MSKEYIDKSKLLEDVDVLISKEQEQGNINSASYALKFVKALIDSTSAADVAEVVHGEWKPEKFNDGFGNEWTNYNCSACGRKLIGYSKPKEAPYCHCGAKMGGGKRENK